MKFKKLILLFCAGLLGMNAFASVVIGGTRVVYPAGVRDVNIQLTNNGSFPALVQSWIDKGDPQAKPENIEVPFILSPPMFRMDPGKGQNLRLVYTGGSLPNDRESVFWLNVLEVPPKPGDDVGANYLQFAIRSRLKIFYRPAALAKADPLKAASAMLWELQAAGPKKWTLLARNPTPFNVSLAEVRLESNGQKLSEPLLGMVPPLGELRFDFEIKDGGVAPSKGQPDTVFYKYVDDYGSIIDGNYRLTAPGGVAAAARQSD